MGKIVVSQNVTLDGVVQDPMGEEGLGRGNWFGWVSDADREEWAKVLLDEALAAQALLLGRRSDAWFAQRWTSRTGPWADRLNAMPKYVVSSTLDEPRWGNATVLKADEISSLKHDLDGEIVVYGSAQLVHTLMEQDLVDELRLIVFPVALGAGGRLLGETAVPRPLRLAGSRTIGDGLVLLSYERA